MKKSASRRRANPSRSYYTFDTEPKEEFDEYTHPEIRLMLSAKKN